MKIVKFSRIMEGRTVEVEDKIAEGRGVAVQMVWAHLLNAKCKIVDKSSACVRAPNKIR